MVLVVTFFDSGIRAIRTVESRSPSPSYNDTKAQLVLHEPAAPRLHRMPSPRQSETATVHGRVRRPRACPRAPSTRTGGVAPPNAPRAPWAVGPASFSRASCCPTHPTPPRPRAAPRERSASRPDAPHAASSTLRRKFLTLRSTAATARSPGRARYSVRIAVTWPTAQR